MGSRGRNGTADGAGSSGCSRGTRGFTLIEILVALAVAAILAAIALPSYTEYVRRGKVADALGAMSTYRVQLEQFYQDNRNYGSTATGCGVPAPDSAYFTISCSWGASSTSQSFVVTASGRAAGGMDGFVFTVDEAGAQRTLQFAGTTASVPCWKRRREDTC